MLRTVYPEQCPCSTDKHWAGKQCLAVRLKAENLIALMENFVRRMMKFPRWKRSVFSFLFPYTSFFFSFSLLAYRWLIRPMPLGAQFTTTISHSHCLRIMTHTEQLGKVGIPKSERGLPWREGKVADVEHSGATSWRWSAIHGRIWGSSFEISIGQQHEKVNRKSYDHETLYSRRPVRQEFRLQNQVQRARAS